MVVVRESPRAKHSPEKSTAQWPPQSPFQALLSSPSGRKKWQDRRNRDNARSVSPSPVKGRATGVMSQDSDEDEAEDEDEDEEMLKLKIEAMQAKLKLKKLQKSKKEGLERDESIRTSSRARSRSSSPQKSSTTRPRSQIDKDEVEVPLSPTKDRNPPKEQTSPARVRLGMASMREAGGVSLKRARDGTQLPQSRADSRRGELSGVPSTARPATSFSERLAQSKAESQQRREKDERVERQRSRGFGLASNGTESRNDGRASALNGRATPRVTNASNVGRPSSAHQMQSSSRMLGSGVSGVARSASTRTARPSERRQIPRANGLFTSRSQDPTSQNGNMDLDSDDSDHKHHADETSSDTPPSFYDPFSDIHLSKRQIPHPDITRALSGKEIYTLPCLLKEVTAPHYDPPDCESDFVVFGVLTSKSSPFDQKATHRTNDENNPQEDAEKPRNKFMVMHLTDLKWELDLFLFGSAFDQFWKLTPGTLLAILNPGIMPPKTNQHNGRFSLKLGSSEDCIMEIGIARDLGYCVSVKKDGQSCGSWIDKRHTEICEFHLNLMIDRERKSRMEVNTMWRSRGNQDNRMKSRSKEEGGFDSQINGNKNRGTYHREYGQLYSIPGGGKSTAKLLDAEDKNDLDNMTQAEASRKRIAASQKERDLAKALGKMGKGVGAEYLRAKHTSTSTTTTTFQSTMGIQSTEQTKSDFFEKPSAADLGLLNKKATDEHLSPAKDRKRHFGLGAISTTGSEAMGWGGARKAGLLQPKESKVGSPEKGQTTLRPGIVRGRSEDGSSVSSPSKKRARFALEKGIREPGRESLGMDFKNNALGHEDEEDLDIV